MYLIDGTLVATLPGAWCYRDHTRTGWPGVTLPWLDEIASLVYLDVAARTIAQAAASLRYSLDVAGMVNKPSTVLCWWHHGTGSLLADCVWQNCWAFSGVNLSVMYCSIFRVTGGSVVIIDSIWFSHNVLECFNRGRMGSNVLNVSVPAIDKIVLHLALEYQELDSGFLFPVHFLLFPAVCCSLSPLSFCFTGLFTFIHCFPWPSSAATITWSRYMTTCMMAKWSCVQTAHFMQWPVSSRWGTKKDDMSEDIQGWDKAESGSLQWLVTVVWNVNTGMVLFVSMYVCIHWCMCICVDLYICVLYFDVCPCI